MVRAFIVPNLHICVHGCRSLTPGGDGEMREHELVRCLPFRPQIPRIGPPDLRCVLLPCSTRACSRLPNSGPWTEYGPCVNPRSPPGFPAVCPRAGDLHSSTRSSARVYKVRSGRPSPGGDNATGKRAQEHGRASLLVQQNCPGTHKCDRCHIRECLLMCGRRRLCKCSTPRTPWRGEMPYAPWRRCCVRAWGTSGLRIEALDV